MPASAGMTIRAFIHNFLVHPGERHRVDLLELEAGTRHGLRLEGVNGRG
jgi:hypothetical protein